MAFQEDTAPEAGNLFLGVDLTSARALQPAASVRNKSHDVGSEDVVSELVAGRAVAGAELEDTPLHGVEVFGQNTGRDEYVRARWGARDRFLGGSNKREWERERLRRETHSARDNGVRRTMEIRRVLNLRAEADE